MACCCGQYLLITFGAVFILSCLTISECLRPSNTTEWLQHPWKFAYNRMKNNRRMHIGPFPFSIGRRVEKNSSSIISKNPSKHNAVMGGNETEIVSENSLYSQSRSTITGHDQSTVTTHTIDVRPFGSSSTLKSRLLAKLQDEIIISRTTHIDSTSTVENGFLSKNTISVNKRNTNWVNLSALTVASLLVPKKRSFTATTISSFAIPSTNSDIVMNTPRQNHVEPVVLDSLSVTASGTLVIAANHGQRNPVGTLRPNIHQPARISDPEHAERPSGEHMVNSQTVVASSGLHEPQLDHIQAPVTRQDSAQSEIAADNHGLNQPRVVSTGTETATHRPEIHDVNHTGANMAGRENAPSPSRITSLGDNIIPTTNDHHRINAIVPDILGNESSYMETSSGAVHVGTGGDTEYTDRNTTTADVGQRKVDLTVSAQNESLDTGSWSEASVTRFPVGSALDNYTNNTLPENNTRDTNIHSNNGEHDALGYEQSPVFQQQHSAYSSTNLDGRSMHTSNITSSNRAVSSIFDNSAYIQPSSSYINRIQFMVTPEVLDESALVIFPTVAFSSESTLQITALPPTNNGLTVIESSREVLHTYISASDSVIIPSDMPNIDYALHSTQSTTPLGPTHTEDIWYQERSRPSQITLPLLNKPRESYSTIEPTRSTSNTMTAIQQGQLLSVRYAHAAVVIVEELHPSHIVPHRSVLPDDATDSEGLASTKLTKGIFIQPVEDSGNELINNDVFNDNITETNSGTGTQSGRRQQQYAEADLGEDAKDKTTESDNLKETSKADNNAHKRIPINDVTVYSKRQPVPSVYIKLQLKMGWNEFCDSRVTFCLEIRDIVKNKTRKEFAVEQIVFMNVEIAQCDVTPYEKTEEIINIKMYFADQDRKFSSDLTQAGSAAIKHGFNAMNNSVFREKVIAVELEISPYYPEDGNDTAMEPDLSASGTVLVIVIATVGGVCSVALVILQIILMKRRYSQKMRARRSESVALSSVRPRPRSHSGYTNAALETDIQTSLSNPITFSAMAVYAMDENICKEEFQILPTPVVSKTDIRNSCAGKNRYSTVLPTPSTRVKLAASEDGMCESDYINANYIKNSDGTRSVYIATQAPTDATQTDFWRMVWEQQSRVIVMLCKLQERGMTCSSYWPDTDKADTMRFYGDYEVVMKKREVKRDYTISTLSLKFMEKNLKRDVKHVWFKAWPATGSPEVLSLVRFVRDVIRPCTEQATAPVIVHCSTGVGRTGVLIAVVWLMTMYDKRKNIDVLRCVSSLRHQRAGMVQDWRQYMFIYKVMNEYAVLLNTLSLRSRSSTVSSITTIT